MVFGIASPSVATIVEKSNWINIDTEHGASILPELRFACTLILCMQILCRFSCDHFWMCRKKWIRFESTISSPSRFTADLIEFALMERIKKNSFFSLIIFISETKNFTINMHSSQLDSPCPSRCTHCFCNYNSNRRMSIALLFLRAFRWKIPRTSDQISQWRLRKLDIFIWRMALGGCNRISVQLYCVSCHMYWLIDRSADWRHSQSNPEYYVDSSIVWWTIANFPPVCVCGPISK